MTRLFRQSVIAPLLIFTLVVQGMALPATCACNEQDEICAQQTAQSRGCCHSQPPSACTSSHESATCACAAPQSQHQLRCNCGCGARTTALGIAAENSQFRNDSRDVLSLDNASHHQPFGRTLSGISPEAPRLTAPDPPCRVLFSCWLI